MQVGKFWADQIHVAANVVKTVLCCNREAGTVGQSRIKESTFAVHLEICDKGIPVGHRTPTCPGMQIDSCQTKRRRDEGRGRFRAVKSLSIHEKLGIEFSWPPSS